MYRNVIRATFLGGIEALAGDKEEFERLFREQLVAATVPVMENHMM